MPKPGKNDIQVPARISGFVDAVFKTDKPLQIDANNSERSMLYKVAKETGAFTCKSVTVIKNKNPNNKIKKIKKYKRTTFFSFEM